MRRYRYQRCAQDFPIITFHSPCSTGNGSLLIYSRDVAVVGIPKQLSICQFWFDSYFNFFSSPIDKTILFIKGTIFVSDPNSNAETNGTNKIAIIVKTHIF